MKMDTNSNEVIIQLLCCDLSLNRPGFAVLECNATRRTAKLLYKSHVDNKSSKHKADTHAQKLKRIADELRYILLMFPYAYPVQEDALGMMTVLGGKNLYSAKTVQALAQVVGVADYITYDMGHGEFDKIPPKMVKKRVTGNSSAEKDDVAKALEFFVGAQDYACDDESDAVAVGIAWLIDHNYLDDPFAETAKKS